MGSTRLIRCAVAGACVLAVGVGMMRASAVAPRSGPLDPTSTARTSQAPSVLFLGDSVMDQQGSHAAFLLRDSGIDARVVARWGSTLFTPGQYRNGRPQFVRAADDPSTHWLSLAPRVIDRYRPTHVVVELDHNYWRPPTDRRGQPITDLSSPSARSLVDTQLRVFVRLIRSRGAQVLWVAPTPSETVGAQLLWPQMRRQLRNLGVPIIDPNAALRRADGSRRTSARDCSGEPRPLFLADQVHLTRFGSGVSGTALAEQIASRLRLRLNGSNAPGEAAVAIVTSPGGYHVVACDGSIFAFGTVATVRGVRSQVIGGPPVVDAHRAPDGGLWLVRADGSVITAGTELQPPAPLALPIRGADIEIPDTASGRRVIDRRGVVVEYDGAVDLGDVTEVLPTDPFERAWAIDHPRPPIIDAVATPGGFYALTENGEVIARGLAVSHGDTADLALYTD